MEILKPNEVKTIEQFFQLKQENLLRIMNKFLNTKYDKVYSTKEYVVAVGDIPIALVAHLDTVFSSPPENIFYDRVKNVMWSPDGLGADDRAGVYSIVQILKHGFKPTIIFTTDEEKGAKGAVALAADFEEPPTDLKYIIELDRRGSVDCVFYECDNPEFEEYVENFGFVTAWGTFSDISILCPHWQIAGVNLSIGYEDEHSYQETLYVGRMLSTIKKVENMLNAVSDDMEPFKYIPLKYTYGKYGNYAYAYAYDDYDYDWDPSWGVTKEQWKAWHENDNTDLLKCSKCGQKNADYNLFPVKGLENNTIFLCSDCVSKQDEVGWCLNCGEPFIIAPNDQDVSLCYDCRGKGGNK